MNDEAMKWITELEKAAKVRTPVGATYAVALALMHVAAQLEKIAENSSTESPNSIKAAKPKA
jgi:hypothetical protein